MEDKTIELLNLAEASLTNIFKITGAQLCKPRKYRKRLNCLLIEDTNGLIYTVKFAWLNEKANTIYNKILETVAYTHLLKAEELCEHVYPEEEPDFLTEKCAHFLKEGNF